MDKNIIAFAATLVTLTTVLLLSNAEAISNLTKDPPKTVDYVDLVKYFGVWYEQAAIPNIF